jgi:hypothetical protein
MHVNPAGFKTKIAEYLLLPNERPLQLWKNKYMRIKI